MRPSIDWLITDTHFFHDAIVELSGRPVDFAEKVICNLKHVVARQDTLYHLGDVIFYRYPELSSILGQVPCRKVLLMGNHDRKSRGWYMRNGFDYAADLIVLDHVMLSHKPIESFPDGVTINIHGHWHNNEHHKRPAWYDPGRYRLLSIERTNYRPAKLWDFAK